MSEHMDTITLPKNRLMVISNDIDGFVSANCLRRMTTDGRGNRQRSSRSD